MNRFFGRKGRRSVSLDRNRAQLRLELLETRDCPSVAPQLTLAVAPVGNGLVQVSGNVTGDNPQTTVVHLSGAVRADLLADEFGHYSLQIASPNPGALDVVAVDADGLVSNTVTGLVVALADNAGRKDTVPQATTVMGPLAGLADSGDPVDPVPQAGQGPWIQEFGDGNLGSENPVILDFYASEGAYGYWTIGGSVADDWPEGLTITLGGLPSLVGRTVEVDWDGTFTIVIHIPNGEFGTGTAVCTDPQGHHSATASTPISPT